MKRIIMTLITAIMIAVSANAMSYNEARHEANIITNQMARELNLSRSQYNAVLQVNFNHLYYRSSRSEMARILTPSQYRTYKALYRHRHVVAPAKAPRHHATSYAHRHNWHHR